MDVSRPASVVPEKENKKVTFNEVPIVLDSNVRVSKFPTRKHLSYKPRINAYSKQRQLSHHEYASDKPKKDPKTNASKCVRRKTTLISKKPDTAVHCDATGMSTFDANIYAKPQLHSTLHLAEMLRAVKLDQFEPSKVISEKLERCTVTKRRLNEKSTQPVNIPASAVVFQDVTPLEFDHETLLTMAAKEKEMKLKTVEPSPRLRDPEPDINEFWTEDMEPEYVSLPESNYEFSYLFEPSKAPSTSAYNLYKHMRTWEEVG